MLASMGKRAFHKIAAGLTDAIAITQGRAHPTAYRTHAPCVDKLVAEIERKKTAREKPEPG